MRWLRTCLVVITLMALLVGCGNDNGNSSEALTVFAASSLTEAFTDIGQEFEQANPGVDVRFQFGGSPTLAAQIGQGASADVFASADEETMTKLADDTGVVDDAEIFASNKLIVIVEPGNPKMITDIRDLARSDVTSVLCSPEVPCGALAATALKRAGITVAARSYEENVKAVVAKVALGEVDAGIGYVSDVDASKQAVEGIAINEADNVRSSYPVAVLRTSDQQQLAKEFVALVLSEKGRRILTSHALMVP